MPLFDIPDEPKPKENGNKIKLKKGETIYTLIKQAEKLVNEKLGNYRDASKCVTSIDKLREFFNNTEDDGIIRDRY